MVEPDFQRQNRGRDPCMRSGTVVDGEFERIVVDRLDFLVFNIAL